MEGKEENENEGKIMRRGVRMKKKRKEKIRKRRDYTKRKKKAEH